MSNLPDPLDSSNSHRYISNAGEDIREMLATIGVDSIDALFESIPADVKLKGLLDIPGPWSEIQKRASPFEMFDPSLIACPVSL